MYEVKVLSNDEFDHLPIEITRGSQIYDSLGFADPSTGKAYVRYNVYQEVTKYLINHEVEELVNEYSDDEDEFGIRHKKGKKFFKQIFMPLASIASAFIPGVGPYVSAGMGATTGFLNRPKPPSELPQSSGFSNPFSMFQGQDQLPMTASPRTPEALPMMGGGSNIMGGGNKLNNDFLSRL